jgi:nucleoid-associated protein YgaU
LLQLGDLVFDIDDYPEEVPIGGTSLVSIEKYPGGQKSLQFFGAFDDTITIKGTFMYEGAHDKAGKVDAMWRRGQPVQFIAGQLMPRWVIITAAKFTYKNEYMIDYEISLERISSDDPNIILYGSPSPTTSSTSSSSIQLSISSDASASTQKTHTVVYGDTLWKIAQQYYGDGSQYTKIVQANDIKNPSVIDVGQKLVIP